MPTNDPWVEIAVPNAVGNFNMNMVDVEGLKCQVFWAVSGDNRCSLLLRTESDYSSVIEPPTLKGLDISYDRSNRLLIYILNDNDQRTIFWSLCNDIIDSTKQAESEEEALNIAINRSWKWHFLLRGGRSGKLSIEEQKGLIGELLVLEGVVMQGMTHSEAISCWLGPFDSPKDFIIGDMGIEVKARRGAAAPFITINSEHQLDSSDISKLFLHVCHINPSPGDVENGITLDRVVDRIFNQIMLVKPDAMNRLCRRLVMTGCMTILIRCLLRDRMWFIWLLKSFPP